MQVIANRSTKLLIKGKVYEVSVIRQYYNRAEYYIEVKGVPTSFDLDAFTNLDGSPIAEKEFKADDYWWEQSNQLKTLERGDIVLCVSKKLKTLTYGKYYTVAKANIEGGSAYHSTRTVSISLKESTKGENFYYRTYYNNFRKIPKNIVRDINLNNILDGVMVEEMKNYLDPIFANREKEVMVLNLIQKSFEHLYKSGVNASLRELIEHRVSYDKYLTMEDVDNFDFNKIMNY